MKKGSGWRNESHRHRLAGMGIKTTDIKIKASGLSLREMKRNDIKSNIIVNEYDVDKYDDFVQELIFGFRMGLISETKLRDDLSMYEQEVR